MQRGKQKLLNKFMLNSEIKCCEQEYKNKMKLCEADEAHSSLKAKYVREIQLLKDTQSLVQKILIPLQTRQTSRFFIMEMLGKNFL